jgi:putative endonuclease
MCCWRNEWVLKNIEQIFVTLNLFQGLLVIKKRKNMREHNYYIYILATGFNGTLYIGVTNDLMRRVYEHINGAVKGFTSKYGKWRLVYYEHGNCIEGAIMREKQLKNWHRDWKKNLIERDNPHWDDLYLSLCGKVDAETSSA